MVKLDLAFVVPALFGTGKQISHFGFGGTRANVSPSALAGSRGSGGEFDAPPLTSTLQLSQLMYSFQNLRAIVKEHEKTFNEGLSAAEQAEVGIVEFDSPSLVDTRNSDYNPFPSAKMRNPVKSADILHFLEKNYKYLRQGEGEDMEFAPEGDITELPYMAKKLKELDSVDGDIIEFDDQFSESEEMSETTLVYGIVVNRSEKRIVVVFRGSVNDKDWKVNLTGLRTCPQMVKDFSGDKFPQLHRGFTGYLINQTFDDKKAKIDQIISILTEMYNCKESDYHDYDLYITGHSLGGVLSQLTAFVLAGSDEAAFIPKPINAVTFASPTLGGGDDFVEVFQGLERADKLRHIRVSNKHDLVPVAVAGYTQMGVNLHVKEGKKMDVEYKNPKSFISQFSFDAAARHMLEGEGSYFSRLYCKDGNGELLNKDILEKSIDQLYEDYAGF